MQDDHDVSVLDGYVSRYLLITRLVHRDLVEEILEASGVRSGEPLVKGTPHLKYRWHVPTDVFLAYTFEGGLDWGDPIECTIPVMKVIVWPQNNLDLIDQIPNLEPAIVLHIVGHYSDWHDFDFSAWVQEGYLQTAQGKLLATQLMLAKLALAEDDDDA